jgi:hypothetical protein
LCKRETNYCEKRRKGGEGGRKRKAGKRIRGMYCVRAKFPRKYGGDGKMTPEKG